MVVGGGEDLLDQDRGVAGLADLRLRTPVGSQDCRSGQIHCRQRFGEAFQRVAKLQLGVVFCNDQCEPWEVLAMPTTRPADGMDRRGVATIAADQGCRQGPGLLQRCMRGGIPCRFGKAPMQVQLVLHLAGLLIGPAPAAAHHQRCRPQQALQPCAGIVWRHVTFDRQCQAVDKVLLASLWPLGESCNGRAEYHRPWVLRATCGLRSSGCDQTPQPVGDAVDADLMDRGGIFVKGA